MSISSMQPKYIFLNFFTYGGQSLNKIFSGFHWIACHPVSEELVGYIYGILCCFYIGCWFD